MSSRGREDRLAVIIPGYNHGHYIGDAIESALSQSRAPDRILVLDDGSQDDTTEVARRYAKDGVEVEEQKNVGAHNTLNRLVQKAATDCGVIAILNSDDCYLPGRFAACMDALSDPETSLVCTPLELMDDDGNALPEDHPRARWFRTVWNAGSEEGLSLATWLGIANFPATTSNIVARSDFLTAHPLRDYRYCHDYFLLATAAIQGRMKVLDGAPLLRYRVHATNTITTAPENLVREMARMRLELSRDLAPSLGDSATRDRFKDFLQGLWGNVSSIPEGEVQVAVAELLRDIEPARIERAAAALPATALNTFPNRALINLAEADHPLGRGPELARRVQTLAEEKASAKSRADLLRETVRLRFLIGRSRWIAVGTLLGSARRLGKNDGSSPVEKLDALRAAIASNAWVSLGCRLGSRSSRQLIEAVQTDHKE